MTIPVSWILSCAAFFGGLIVWLAKLSFERALDQRDKRFEREENRKEEEAKRKEAERHQRDELIVRGLKTLTDSQYEVIYAMQNGHHNGGLDECMTNIQQYRADVNAWLIGGRS